MVAVDPETSRSMDELEGCRVEGLECRRQGPESPRAHACYLLHCTVCVSAAHWQRHICLKEEWSKKQRQGKQKRCRGLARLMLTHVGHCEQKLCCARPPLRERRMSEEAAAKLSAGPLLELAFEVEGWAHPPGWRPRRSSPAPPRRLRRGAKANGKDGRGICNPRGRSACGGVRFAELCCRSLAAWTVAMEVESSAERGAAQEQARARAPPARPCAAYTRSSGRRATWRVVQICEG